MGYFKRNKGKRSYNKKNNKERKGLYVEVYNNNVEFAIKKFKKMVKESKLMLDLKKNERFTPNSEKTNRTSKKSRKVYRKKLKNTSF